MKPHEIMVQLALMHAALQGAVVAAGPTGDADVIAARAWDIADAAMHAMPPAFRQGLVKLGEET